MKPPPITSTSACTLSCNAGRTGGGGAVASHSESGRCQMPPRPGMSCAWPAA
ncbi:hypothetical protein ACHMW5_16500 [Azospirillum melinis]|uniref:hypothetical protein n=1 Tax=Azospirillum melinis TaxID=328839 RepID=UPI003757DA3C